jgi:DNA-binding transcriptional ArsR family regulator
MDALQALGDPVRRRLVELLANSPATAGELARIVGSEHGISQPAVSRHLRILREAGLVESSVDGQHRVYALNRESFDALAEWIDSVRTEHHGRHTRAE